MEEKLLQKNFVVEEIVIDNKNALKKLLNFLLLDEKVKIRKEEDILNKLKDKLILPLLNYNEFLDGYIIANLIAYQKMSKIDLYKNMNNFLKFMVFINIFTKDINMTSQIMSNSISVLNDFLEFTINNYDSLKKNKNITDSILELLKINIDLILNTKSFNPRLISFFIRIINLAQNDRNALNKISEYIVIYSDYMKNDINYDILFQDVYKFIKNLENKKIFDDFIKNYEENKVNAKNKKNVKMNFLVIKKKPLTLLEPDYDLSFLGDYFLNEAEHKKKMEKIMKRKVRETEKQAIRKLKKEGRVIDVERNKVIENINNKRKEDIKFVNQYMEQQNIEYKKMMSSNEKKRFKFKKKK